jgi:hypothetical protein
VAEGFIVIDVAGKVVGTHTWGYGAADDHPHQPKPPAHCPIAPPADGEAIEASRDVVEAIVDVMREGGKPEVFDDVVIDTKAQSVISSLPRDAARRSGQEVRQENERILGRGANLAGRGN